MTSGGYRTRTTFGPLVRTDRCLFVLDTHYFALCTDWKLIPERGEPVATSSSRLAMLRQQQLEQKEQATGPIGEQTAKL
jgi:hypothetical protein